MEGSFSGGGFIEGGSSWIESRVRLEKDGVDNERIMKRVLPLL